MFALTNVRIYDFENYIENGYIVFDEKIREVGEMNDFADKGYETTEGKGHVAMPSMVIGHGHIYSAFARGMPLSSNPANFKEILEDIWWKLDAGLTAEDTYLSGIVSAVDFARNGVTTIIDHHAGGTIRGSLGLLKEAVCAKTGLRGSFCFETSDRFNVEDCISENLSEGDMFGLHASMTLSEETLGKVKEAVGDMPIHIHAAESWLDQENSLTHYGERVVERLARHGLLNKNSILAHCIHINEKEAELIAANGCRVALNAGSNMNNAVGLPDYRMMKDAGVRCIIGNDGMSAGMAGEWMTLYTAMKHRYSSPSSFTMEDLLEIINNTYEHVNEMMGIRVGRIASGYDADILSVEYMPPTPMDGRNALGHVLFGMTGNFTPEHVWCAGRQVVRHGHVDAYLEDEYKKAAAAAEKLWKRIGI